MTLLTRLTRQTCLTWLARRTRARLCMEGAAAEVHELCQHKPSVSATRDARRQSCRSCSPSSGCWRRAASAPKRAGAAGRTRGRGAGGCCGGCRRCQSRWGTTRKRTATTRYGAHSRAAVRTRRWHEFTVQLRQPLDTVHARGAAVVYGARADAEQSAGAGGSRSFSFPGQLGRGGAGTSAPAAAALSRRRGRRPARHKRAAAGRQRQKRAGAGRLGRQRGGCGGAVSLVRRESLASLRCGEAIQGVPRAARRLVAFGEACGRPFRGGRWSVEIRVLN